MDFKVGDVIKYREGTVSLYTYTLVINDNLYSQNAVHYYDDSGPYQTRITTTIYDLYTNIFTEAADE